jgi:hypothetical protein
MAEEGSQSGERMVPPVLKEARALGCDAPVVRIRDQAPAIHFVADGIDDRGVVVALVFSR